MNTPLTPLLPGGTSPSRGSQRPPLREELRPFQDELKREVSRSRDDVPLRESKGKSEPRDTAASDRGESPTDRTGTRDDTLRERNSPGDTTPAATVEQGEAAPEADDRAEDELELSGDTPDQETQDEESAQVVEAVLPQLAEALAQQELPQAVEEVSATTAGEELPGAAPSADNPAQQAIVDAEALRGETAPSQVGEESSAASAEAVVSLAVAEKTERDTKPVAAPTPAPELADNNGANGPTDSSSRRGADVAEESALTADAATPPVVAEGADAAPVTESTSSPLAADELSTETPSPEPAAPERTPAPDARGVSPATGLREPNLATANSQRPQGEQPSPHVDASRFVSRVARAFEAAEQRGGVVQLRLSPPELGAMRIELSVQQGVLSAHLETETAAAKSVLLDNLPALRERLAAQDIRVDRFDVDVRQESTGGQPDWQAQQEAREREQYPSGHRAPRTARRESPEPTVATTPIISTLHSSGRFNALA